MLGSSSEELLTFLSLQLCELRGRRNEYGSVVNVAFTT
ncbi:unnamed protein product [Acanthoscelides obtectus]|uniref:Uncharacterized protein n=1 Tax=Acanthoscelides obtectus TaxID=200917 RepID=A0A9P0KGX8_ACAOB|nr:unnamed protein product [Acanthoscelides obtectus]CAK1657597.1 hypothetical protein AOBTE_LOCUS20439 [Acanthoscelides obtectus]